MAFGGIGKKISLTALELNFGRSPLNEKTFSITDSRVSSTSKLLMNVVSNFGDENEGELLGLTWKCNTGTFALTATAVFPEKVLQGIFRVNYFAS